MKKTKYIKGKDGKFAGSIGTGKTSVPTPAPIRPSVPFAEQPGEPMVFPRAVNFTNLVSRHAHAYSELALYGVTPKQAATYSRYESSHYEVLLPGHVHHHLSQPLHSPEELSDIYANLGDGDHNQKRVLLELEYLTDSCTDFAEFYREDCEECSPAANLNVPEYFDGYYCPRHEHISEITNLADVSTLIEEATNAVEEDYLPQADSDREAAIVLTTLLPDPYHPENYPSA